MLKLGAEAVPELKGNHCARTRFPPLPATGWDSGSSHGTGRHTCLSLAVSPAGTAGWVQMGGVRGSLHLPSRLSPSLPWAVRGGLCSVPPLSPQPLTRGRLGHAAQTGAAPRGADPYGWVCWGGKRKHFNPNSLISGLGCYFWSCRHRRPGWSGGCRGCSGSALAPAPQGLP